MNICPEEQNLWPPGGSETPGAELRARVGGASQHDCLSSPEKVPLQSLCTAVGEGDPGSPHVSYRFSPSALSILKCSVCLRSFLGNKTNQYGILRPTSLQTTGLLPIYTA